MAGEIDRQNGTPIYIQLREIIRAHIVSACPPGSALPSERDLAERFGLAIGFWIVYIAAGLALVALVGWVYEYSRGDHAH